MKYILILFIIFTIISSTFASNGHSHLNTAAKVESENLEKITKTVWTCSMHPQIKSDKPGKCPICSMDLIPLVSDTGNDDVAFSDKIVKLSKRAQKLAEVQTSIVTRDAVFAELLLTGTLDYDETQAAVIVSHFRGRVEKLFANYTGMYVQKGTHLVEVFSSDLYVFQGEILLTHNALVKAEKTNNIRDIEYAKKMEHSARNKMRVLGLTSKQVEQIIKRGTVSDTLSLYSPISGVIIEKNIVQGQHFKAGEPLFVISNLNDLWLMLDAYEQDLSFLRYGQKVEFEVDAVPGKKFIGKIVYIDPVLDRKTRASKIRVIVDNSKKILKPGMFARSTVFVQLGEKGVVLAESLKDKWISPMHPQILKDHPGKCDICEIELVPANLLGLVRDNDSNLETAVMPIVIPDSAPLITGKRAVVYVKIKPGTYEARTITLGPKAGKFYLVYAGLHEGEKVVTRGNFKIDSELQIKSTNAGMMSLFSADQNEKTKMNMEKKAVADESEQTVFNAVSAFYFDIQKTLSEDDLKDAIQSAELFSDYLIVLSRVQSDKLYKTSNVKTDAILNILKSINKDDSIDILRTKFYKLSQIIAPFLKHLQRITGAKSYKFECTMAFDNKGAFWFQDVTQTANPYFGTAMKGCGTLINNNSEGE